MTGKNEWTCNH